MSVGRKVGVAIVVLLLTTTVSMANVVTATHRTALDPGFVTDTLEEENGYAVIDNVTEQQLKANLEESSGIAAEYGSSSMVENVVEEAVTPEYIRNQTETNIDRTYAFLHGNRDEPSIAIDTEPIVESASAAVAEEIRNASIGTLLKQAGVSLSYQNISVNASLLNRMTSDRQGYQEAKEDIRDTIREQVIDELVNKTFRKASNDELLFLVIEGYNPDAYTESEKEQMVQEREEEIKRALREQIKQRRGDEIDRRIENRLDDLANSTQRVENPQNVTAAAQNVAAVVIDGLATDMTYEEFDSQLTEAKDALATLLADRFESRLSEQIPDTITPTEQLSPQAEQQLQRAQTIVGTMDALGIALPILSLVLIGLLYLLTRSWPTVATETGVSFVLAGLPVFVFATWAKGNIRSYLPEFDPAAEPLVDVAVGFVQQMLAVFSTQSLLLTLVGVGLAAVGAAFKYGYVGSTSGTGAAATATESGDGRTASDDVGPTDGSDAAASDGDAAVEGDEPADDATDGDGASTDESESGTDGSDADASDE